MENIQKDIAALNLRCLLLMRDLARENTTKAVDVFSVAPDVAKRLGAMSVEDLHVFADSTTLMFKPLFDRKTLELLIHLPAEVRGAVMEVKNGTGR